MQAYLFILLGFICLVLPTVYAFNKLCTDPAKTNRFNNKVITVLNIIGALCVAIFVLAIGSNFLIQVFKTQF